MTTLGGIWDGERHLLTMGEHFREDGAAWIVTGYTEQEEEDVLSSFEAPSVEPVLTLTGDYSMPKLPGAGAEQAWGTLSVILTSFASIAGITKQQYQENNHVTGVTVWSFKAKQELGDRI